MNRKKRNFVLTLFVSAFFMCFLQVDKVAAMKSPIQQTLDPNIIKAIGDIRDSFGSGPEEWDSTAFYADGKNYSWVSSGNTLFAMTYSLVLDSSSKEYILIATSGPLWLDGGNAYVYTASAERNKAYYGVAWTYDPARKRFGTPRVNGKSSTSSTYAGRQYEFLVSSNVSLIGSDNQVLGPDGVFFDPEDSGAYDLDNVEPDEEDDDSTSGILGILKKISDFFGNFFASLSDWVKDVFTLPENYFSDQFTDMKSVLANRFKQAGADDLSRLISNDNSTTTIESFENNTRVYHLKIGNHQLPQQKVILASIFSDYQEEIKGFIRIALYLLLIIADWQFMNRTISLVQFERSGSGKGGGE